jgi:hypothetical protein
VVASSAMTHSAKSNGVASCLWEKNDQIKKDNFLAIAYQVNM